MTSQASSAKSMASKASMSATKAGAVSSSKSKGGVGAQPTAAMVGAGAAMAGILGVAAML